MRHFSLSVGFALCLLQGSRGAIGPITDLHIVNAALQPDGFTRQTVVAEGTFPGPVITGKKGDNFKINVINQLTNETMLTDTTIHWNGIQQKHTIWADGSAFVTQCPITSGHSFLYDFNVTDQAGTFWYHSHIGTQYCDGLRGPMIVYDPNDPYLSEYDVDDESTIITIADWYHVTQPKDIDASPPSIADSILINGLGRFAGGTSPLAIIFVEYGKRYRFRLIALSCDASYVFSIDGHALTIIEADGQNTKKLTVDSINILPGQRYSFILEAKQKVDNYWIRAVPNAGPTGFDGGVNSAILRYVGAKEVDPTTPLTTSQTPLLEGNLRALDSPGAPGKHEIGGADVSLRLNITFDAGSGKFLVNGVSFVLPPTPVLQQVLDGAKSVHDLLPAGSVYSLPHNSVVELSFFDGGDAAGGHHPIHIAGHTVDVIRSSGSNTTNFIDPVRRDVVSSGGPGENVTIRFTTEKAGPFLCRCHIDPHYARGLAIVFVTDMEDTASENPIPAAWNDLCKIYDAKHSS